MKRLILLAALWIATTAGAQEIRKETFAYAVRESDTLRLDRYAALTPDSRKRPCLMFLFGGGFMTGTRDNRRFRPFFDYYARKGFVVVSIDYRLGLKEPLAAGKLSPETFPQLLPQTVLMAVEDLYDATSFVAGKSAEWGIDPARIVACGSSAGAITVLQGAYFIANENPLTAKLPDGFDYAGVISFAGAVVDMADDLTWKRAPAPIMLFHGDADRNVPYDTVPVPGGGVLFGSAAVARDLAQRGVPYWFVSEAGADHSMAWRPMREHFAEIDAFLDRFVFGGERRRFETRIVPPDAPERPAAFAIDDYLDANYGHYVPGKKRQPSETFRKGYRQ